MGTIPCFGPGLASMVRREERDGRGQEKKMAIHKKGFTQTPILTRALPHLFGVSHQIGVILCLLGLGDVTVKRLF